MKSLTPEFREHVSGEVTTLCRCWVVEMTDGQMQGFTDHDEDLTVEGVTCERSAGVEPAAIEEQLGLNVDTAEISGALQSNSITEDKIKAGIYDNAKVTTYIVNWSTPEEYVLDRVMLIGEILQEDSIFRFELRGVSSLLDQTRGRHFIKRCQADLGDERCKFDTSAAGFNAMGTLDHANSPSSLTVSGLGGFGNGWFSHGSLMWTSGANTGIRTEVINHIAGNGEVRLDLWQSMAGEMVPGDQFDIIAGCDKLFSTCKSKFSNALNFQGFPHIPGDGFALSHAGSSSGFDGKPLVP